MSQAKSSSEMWFWDLHAGGTESLGARVWTGGGQVVPLVPTTPSAPQAVLSRTRAAVRTLPTRIPGSPAGLAVASRIPAGEIQAEVQQDLSRRVEPPRGKRSSSPG